MDLFDAPVSPEMSDADQSGLICGPATPFIGSLVEEEEEEEPQVTSEILLDDTAL